MIPFKLFYLLSSSFLKQTNKNATEWSLDKWKRDWIPVPSERLPKQPWAHSLTLHTSHFSCVEQQQLLLHSGVERSKQGVTQGKHTAHSSYYHHPHVFLSTEKMSKAHLKSILVCNSSDTLTRSEKQTLTSVSFLLSAMLTFLSKEETGVGGALHCWGSWNRRSKR